MVRKATWIVLVLLAWSLLAVLPAHAQNPTWDVRYYNNRYLTEPAARTEQIASVSLGFNWGANGPAQGISADNFSVRWQTTTYFAAATYRFSVLADDAVRVYLDGAPIIDTFTVARAGEILTADIGLAAGNHSVQVDYQEYAGLAYLYFGWANISASIAPPPVSGQWTAQYYANPNLNGLPSLIQTEYSPAHDWGSGSPSPAIPVDHFSARWVGAYQSSAGTYRLTIRVDDGVRAYVDGVLYIDQFHSASAQTYTADINLTAGQHTIVIEYYEIGGAAFLDYSLVLASNPAPAVGGVALVTVGVPMLNVRDRPDAATGNVLTQVSQGATYPIIGRNADSTWWQIQVGNLSGWVTASLVTTTNVLNVPVTFSPSAVPGAFVTVTEAYRLNVRDYPSGNTGSVLARINRGETYPVVGRNMDSTWWQIDVNGTVGWVSTWFVKPLNTQNVPVTSQTVSDVSTSGCPGAPQARLIVGGQGRAVASFGISVRDTPSLSATRIGRIPQNGVFTVLTGGPVCAGVMRWWKVNYNGLIGWSSEGYLSTYWLEPL